MRLSLLCLTFALLAGSATAASAPFDLVGPTLDITVTHAGVVLPIAEAPNLSAGDQVSIKADLPPGQSVHYLLVAAFLRGATNPPPPEWFHPLQTWTAKGRAGLQITVPPDADQAVVFLAPQTGGDFSTLVGAVRGRPGAFVRASQDLNQASLDHSRLTAYLSTVRKIGEDDPQRLKTVSPLLARSLNIKLDSDCFQKSPEYQASCLMQGQDSLVLEDGHSTSIVETLTSGPSVDLVQQLSVTPQAGFGYYSPYVASVIDIARILDSLRTAQYQYIPALAVYQDAQMSLLLNTPPSFHNPKSVLVVALPPIEAPQPPPLRPVDAKTGYCAQRTDLVLAAEGAPLAFSSSYAHDMALRLQAKDGGVVDVPVKADAERGGFVADISGLDYSRFGDVIEAALHGYWGFQSYSGPEFQLQSARAARWRVADDDEQSLTLGREGVVRLQGPDPACVVDVTLQSPEGEAEPLQWKATDAKALAVTVPAQTAQPGPLTLLVKPYGVAEPEPVSVQVFAQSSHLDGFVIHAGDMSGVLRGGRLDQVATLTLAGAIFRPGALSSSEGADDLQLTSSDAQAIAKLKVGQRIRAKVALKDGRNINLDTTVSPARPRVALIGESLQPPAAGAPLAVRLDKTEVPQDGLLSFSIRAQAPTVLSDGVKVEVANAEGAVLSTLAPAHGLTLEDREVALATLDTGKAFSSSTFGGLQFRIVDGEAAGDWQPLATLVRLPSLRSLRCPSERDQPCKLTGANLFLIDSLSNTADFSHAVTVPAGFLGEVLAVPHPLGGQLYVRLHDDPSVVNTIAAGAERPPEHRTPDPA